MLTFLIGKFSDIPAGNKKCILAIIKILLPYNEISIISDVFIKSCINCFSLESTIFPDFIIDIINQHDNIDQDIISIFFDADIINECNDYFHNSKYLEIITSFLSEYLPHD